MNRWLAKTSISSQYENEAVDNETNLCTELETKDEKENTWPSVNI